MVEIIRNDRKFKSMAVDKLIIKNNAKLEIKNNLSVNKLKMSKNTELTVSGNIISSKNKSQIIINNAKVTVDGNTIESNELIAKNNADIVALNNMNIDKLKINKSTLVCDSLFFRDKFSLSSDSYISCNHIGNKDSKLLDIDSKSVVVSKIVNVDQIIYQDVESSFNVKEFAQRVDWIFDKDSTNRADKKSEPFNWENV